jgi:DNA/RNA-binding domain of Phe-tRNA-synthetase-like protein
MRFEVHEEIFEKNPTIRIGVVVGRDIDNIKENEHIKRYLQENIASVLPKLTGKVKEHERVVPYREAFSAFGINPNKFMCSIEALMTRIQKTSQIPSINTVVDMGNAVSLKYMLPIGAHDLGQVSDEIEVRFSRDDDIFIPFGSSEGEPLDKNEVVYASKNNVRTRRWMWRQSEIGKITEKSAYVFFPIDGFVGINEKEVIEARDEIAEIIENRLGGEAIKGYVDKDSPIFSV